MSWRYGREVGEMLLTSFPYVLLTEVPGYIPPRNQQVSEHIRAYSSQSLSGFPFTTGGLHSSNFTVGSGCWAEKDSAAVFLLLVISVSKVIVKVLHSQSIVRALVYESHTGSD